MARQVLPIVGAVAGFVVGGPTGAQIGFALGSLVGNAVDPIEMQGRKLGDAPTQVAAEGGARAIVYGKGCIRATVVMERGGRRVIRQRDRSGGKGGGPTTINERSLWTFAIGLGEPVAAILRIWENEKLVYDVTPESTIPEDTAQFAEKFRFYTGAENQLPDPALEALHGIGNTPYYRGTAYMVFPQYDLTDFGETVPTYRVEVAAEAEVVPDQTLWLYSQSFGNQLVDAAFGNETFMLVGASGSHGPGQVWVSDKSGRNFEQLSVPVAWTFRSVAFGEGKFVISRDFNSVLVYEGGVFTPYSTVNGDAYLVTVYSGGYFVRLGFGGDVERSPDGYTWAPISGGIGISGDVRRALPVGASVIIALTDAALRRSADSGATWGAVTITGGDPYPGSPFNSVAQHAGIIRAYKEVDSATLAIYTSTDDGVFWDVTTHVVGPDAMVGGEVGIVNGRWVTGSLSVLAPEYPPILASEDGLPEFVPQNVIGGPGTSSYSDTIRIVDSQEGVGIAIGRQTDGAIFTFTNTYVGGTVVGEPIPLSFVISEIHQRCEHSDSDYDVSELSELIHGVVIESTSTGAESINSVIGSHFADPSDYDGQIHYIKRGKPVVLTLTEDDLIDDPDQAQRNNAIEYPKKVHFLGQRADLAYASSKSTSSRYSEDARVVGEVTIGSPETYDDPSAPAEVAVKLHKVLWTEAEGEREWVIPDNYLGLVPTDNVGLSYRGELVRCRILNIEDTPGQRKLRMIRDRQSAYTANLTEIPNPPSPTPPQSSVVAPTVMAFIDTSALTDNADTLHYLVALSGANDNWAGAVLQQQLTGEFQSIDSTTLNSIMGVLQNTVSDAAPWYTDTTNIVVVRLYTEDQLESRMEAEFLSNGGAFFLSWEDSGQTQWEIMQFRDAVQDSNGDWVLSHLMRGRKNTETAGHPPGSTFVWIDQAILREPAQTSWVNTTLTHRAVSNGQSPELAAPQDNEYVGNSQREWPVADLLLSRPTADSVLAEAIPRYRFGTSMNPIRSQNMEQFTWVATDGVNTTTVQTPFTTPAYTFDTTGWGSPVTVAVAQWNRLTGDGPTVSEEIV